LGDVYLKKRMVVIEQFHVGFLGDEVVLSQVFLQVLWFFLISVFHQCFILIFTYQPSLCM